MTTNVYDATVGLLTSDSRWSRLTGEWLIYVDDTGYDKIVFDHKLAFLFAGDLPNIDVWKQWINNGRKGNPPIEHLGRMSVIQIDTKTAKVVFMSHPSFPKTSFGTALRAVFAGTGGVHAKACWDANKCAKQAVVTAIGQDIQSGGEVKHLECANRQHNLTAAKFSQLHVTEQAKTKGFIMNINSNQAPIKVQDAANDPSNPTVKALADIVLAGGMSFSAPFPDMDVAWSDEKIKEFEAALQAYAD